MTHREFLDKNYKAISDLQELYIGFSIDNQWNDHMTVDEANNKNEEMSKSIEYAISAIRRNLVNIYRSLLDSEYVLNTRDIMTMGPDMYLTDTIYLCRGDSTLCCRKDVTKYYFLKIENIDSFHLIQTETHDDFPGGHIPYTVYDYPEQALIYNALEKTHQLDKEVDEMDIGHYDYEIETYVY